MLTTLPDELLHHIVGYAAYKPRLPREQSPFRHVSFELRSLSVVDHRLRRICLPFLFANIWISTDTHAKRLQESCSVSSLCPNFAKVLKLTGDSFRGAKMAELMMKTVLPSLTALSTVDLEGLDGIDANLLKAILEHPSISSVLLGRPYQYVVDRSHELYISKFVLSSVDLRPTQEPWLAQGARLLSLNVYDPQSIDEEFDLRKFEGLEVLNLFIDRHPLISFSWLPRFSSAHPHLHQIWLNVHEPKSFPNLSFISSLVEESRKQGLDGDYRISRVCLGRTTSRSQEWHVTGLAIVATSSLKEILMLICSSFPALEYFALNTRSVQDEYSVDEILSALSPFSSLRTLYLSDVFGRPLGCNEYESIQVPDWDPMTTILSYISRLAQSLTGLKSCYIYDHGEADGKVQWSLSGWLRVLDSRNIDSEQLIQHK